MELYQQAKNGEQRHFQLKAGRELHITHSMSHKTHRYAFSVLALVDKGKRVYLYKKKWAFLGILSMLLLAGLPTLGQYSLVQVEKYYLYFFIGCFCLALLFLMLFIRTFRRRDVFTSIYTQLPLVEFWVNLPTRKEYQQFIEALEKTIKLHKDEMKVPFQKQLAGEIRTLRRVSEAGILTESVYQAAKAKLLLMSDENYQSSPDK